MRSYSIPISLVFTISWWYRVSFAFPQSSWIRPTLLHAATLQFNPLKDGTRIQPSFFISIHTSAGKQQQQFSPTRTVLHESSDSNALVSASSSSSSPKDDARLIQSYRAASIGCALVSLLLFVVPDFTMNTLLATKLGSAAGYALAAGLCHVCAGAAQHRRLSSDTYQRLNVGLVTFFGGSLLAMPGEAGFLCVKVPSLIVLPLVTFLRVYGLCVAYTGWKRGVAPNDGSMVAVSTMTQALWKGFLETAKGLKVKDRKKSMTYRNILLLILVGVASSCMEGVFNVTVCICEMG
jgi:hypothetical protein